MDGRAGNVLLFDAHHLTCLRFAGSRQKAAVKDVCFSVDGAARTVAWDARTIQQLSVDSGDIASGFPSTEDTSRH